MISMDLAAHVISALAFAAVLFWLMQVKNKFSFLSHLLSIYQKGGERVIVDWPVKFLKRFAAALSIPLEANLSAATEPVRIQPESLINLFFSHRITSIIINNGRSSEKKPTLEITLAKSLGNVVEASQSIEQAFGGQLKVVIRS